MSNYFRTLLRFEKARAATRDPEEDDRPRARDREERYPADRPRRGRQSEWRDEDRRDGRPSKPRSDRRGTGRHDENRDGEKRNGETRYGDTRYDDIEDRGDRRRRLDRSEPARRDDRRRSHPPERSSPSRRSRLWEDSGELDEDVLDDGGDAWERPPRRQPDSRRRTGRGDDRGSRRSHDDWDDFRPALRASRRRSRSRLGKILSRLRWPWAPKGNSAESLLAYGQLLDSLRATDTHYSAPGVVLASAGGHASVRQVVDGLVQQARAIGVRVALAEMMLDGEERILRSRDDADDGLPTATNLELTGSGTDQILRDWFERATAGHDLLIVQGPPLTQSVDAALLARSGDGLAIVLEPQHTSRAEFDTAIERTRASGCFVLGLVMSRHQHWLPRFLRGFFNTYPRSIRTRARST